MKNDCLNIIDYGQRYKEIIYQLNLKQYFKVSYLDEFGIGTINYYHGTFKQIQDIIKELFESEKLKASSKDNDMYSADTPLYKFDENTYTGYVIKEVGFTLKHYITWKELNIKQNIRFIYELSENHYMCKSLVSTSTSLKKALKKLKSFSKKEVKGSKLAEYDFDDNLLKHGSIKKTGNTYTCNYYYWEKTSYEYDEWDIKSTSFTLQKIKIKEL